MGDLLKIIGGIKSLVIQFLVKLFDFKITMDWYDNGELIDVPVFVIIIYFIAWILLLSFVWILFTNKVNKRLSVSEEEE